MDGRKVTAADISKSSMQLVDLYKSREITVRQTNGDNEFECLREHVRPTTLNIVGADKHVDDIERSIRVVKEGTRCHVYRLPYSRYPRVRYNQCDK